MNRRKPRALPMLLGLPSPSLAKMNRMNTVELAEQVKRLATEEEALNAKISKLEAHRPKPEEKIKMLKESVSRLKVLAQLAQTRMTEKQSRAAAMGNESGYGNGPASPPQPPLSSGYRRASYPPQAPGFGPNSIQPRGPLGPGGGHRHSSGGPMSPRPGQGRPYPPRPSGPGGPGPGNPGNSSQGGPYRGPLGPGGPRQSPPGNSGPGNSGNPGNSNNPGQGPLGPGPSRPRQGP